MPPNATAKLRHLGYRAASNRTLRLRRGAASLSPQQEVLLDITGRLIIHFENVSNRLYHETEVTAEGEARVILSRMLELQREIRVNLAAVFGEGATEDDLLARLRG